MYSAFISKLKQEINKQLPGWEAQKRMAPLGRTRERYNPVSKNKSRESGVLVWLYPNENKIFIRLIVRAEKGLHSGQVAFPGGAVEQNDNDFWNTALREAKEEIGLPSEEIIQVGALTPLYIPHSNFWVHPFVGHSNKLVAAAINKSEVQACFDVDIMQLLNASLKEDRLVLTGSGGQIIAPSYILEGHVVWGATAMVLSELEELIRKITAR